MNRSSDWKFENTTFEIDNFLEWLIDLKHPETG